MMYNTFNMGIGMVVAVDPADKEKAMEAITEAVNNAKADLGIIFDTDVDRAGAVLSDGSELNRNRIIAMLALPPSRQVSAASRWLIYPHMI